LYQVDVLRTSFAEPGAMGGGFGKKYDTQVEFDMPQASKGQKD
jgi:hypothetical protein